MAMFTKDKNMPASKNSHPVIKASKHLQASHFRPHPWHGLEAGPEPPEILNVFVEITPFDLVKYEVDKESGYLHVDRPQRSSSQPPALYGFVPRTYCGRRVQQLSPKSLRGDGDPLAIWTGNLAIGFAAGAVLSYGWGWIVKRFPNLK